MSGNTFGNIFRLTSYGESHGKAIGGVLDGCPSGLKLDLNRIKAELKRRKPGQSSVTSPRMEDDDFEILSGVYGEVTTGAPMGFVIYNRDYRPADYKEMRENFRPSHADFTYEMKYGLRDERGGGRSSARETVARVFAGAIARQLLEQTSAVKITAFTSQVGTVVLEEPNYSTDAERIEQSIVRCPDKSTSDKMIEIIESVKERGDTIGGAITCIIQHVPVGLGEPVFHKLHADLGSAMLSINACHGFEYGSGFRAAAMMGSQHNDPFISEKGEVKTLTNNSGGIQGGISNGMDIFFRVAFKPVSTISIDQQTVNRSGEQVTLTAEGRHDPCVVPRAVPIVEAMAALVMADHYLMNKTSRIT